MTYSYLTPLNNKSTTTMQEEGKKEKPLVNADAAALPDLDWAPLRLGFGHLL